VDAFNAIARKICAISQKQHSKIILKSFALIPYGRFDMNRETVLRQKSAEIVSILGKFPRSCAVNMPYYDLSFNHSLLGNIQKITATNTYWFGANIVPTTRLIEVHESEHCERMQPQDKVIIAQRILKAAAEGKVLSEEDLVPRQQDLVFALRHQKNLMNRMYTIFTLIWLGRRQTKCSWYLVPKDVALLIFSFISHLDWDVSQAAEGTRRRGITPKNPIWAVRIIRDYKTMLKQKETAAQADKEFIQMRQTYKRLRQEVEEFPERLQKHEKLLTEAKQDYEKTHQDFFNNHIYKK
jgi:hypothetical protein